MNNFSTLYVAREYLKNTWICSADNYFTENVFMEESENAFYASEYADGATEEWCIKTDIHFHFIHMRHIKIFPVFIPQFLFLKSFFKIRQQLCTEFFIKEYMTFHHPCILATNLNPYDFPCIISLDELREFDVKYKECTGSKVLREISEKLNCPEGKMTHSEKE